MPDSDFEHRLQDFVSQSFGSDQRIESLHRLTAGASQETWSFDLADQALILRRAQQGQVRIANFGTVTFDQEIATLRSAYEHGVTVPKIRAVLTPGHQLGEGFVMDRLAGEALPYTLFKDPKYASALQSFSTDCAKELAKIHAIPTPSLNDHLPELSAADRVSDLRQTYIETGSNSPILALAIRWLETNPPEKEESTLVHADFRMGNLLIDETGISAVLDWELPYIGDPVFDLGYLCAPCWRFGHYDRPVGGVGQIKDLLSAYKQHSGREVTADHLKFWMIFSSVLWALTCLKMLSTWRTGEVRTLERVVIGTRVSENEIDLMLMLEDALGISAPTRLDFNVVSADSKSGSSRTEELSNALREWVGRDIIPDLEGAALFQSRVARNALGIIERRSQNESRFEQARNQRLVNLGTSAAALNGRLLSGAPDLSDPGILEHLRLLALEAVSLDQPKYAGLKVAKDKWCGE